MAPNGLDRLETYRQCRQAMPRLHRQITEEYLRQMALRLAGKTLGMAHKGVLVFETEHDVAILNDFLLYEVKLPNGRPPVQDKFLRSPPGDPFEKELLAAMASATTGLFRIGGTDPDEGTLDLVPVGDGDPLLLTDFGLSATAPVGSMIFFRCVRVRSLAISSGATFVFPEIESPVLVRKWRELRRKPSPVRFVWFYRRFKRTGYGVEPQ